MKRVYIFWWNGPDVLNEKEGKWPQFKVDGCEVANEVETELKKPVAVETVVLLNKSVVDMKVENIISCKRYNSFDKLIQMTALVLKFVCLLRRKETEKELKNMDLEEARCLWQKEIQKSVKYYKKFEKGNDSVHVFEDEKGVLRVGGHIDNSSLSFDSKFPVLLPKDQHFTELYIWHCHKVVRHNGMKETLTELRSK